MADPKNSSDQHMVRGRTTPTGMVLGHEIPGEIREKARDVEFLNVGALVSASFNIACAHPNIGRTQC